MTLDEAKAYLRIDGDAEDDVVESLIAAAEAYIRAAVDEYDTHRTDADFASLSDMVMRLLICEMYENRAVGADAQKDYSYAVRSMITQLQNWVTEGGTEA